MINVKVVNKTKSQPLPLHPKNIDPFVTQLYEVYLDKESTGSYLFADGGQVMYFFDGGDGFRLGYQTKKDLKEYFPSIRAVPIKGKISVTIEIE